MLDTVRFLIHDVSTTHRLLYNWLINPANGQVKYRVGNDFQGGLLDREFVHFFDSKKSKETFRVHSRWNPSSHYKIYFFFNPAQDCISVEFSNERNFRFQRGDRDTWDYQCSIGWDRFRTYIKAFFFYEFPMLEVQWSCIEILRLDMCFNQMFNSRSDALQYLGYQKLITKKHARETSNAYTNYKTSIFYSAEGYSSKIYHKGTEYEKKDRKEHDKINKLTGKKYYDTEKLQELADRTLRYEIAFKKRKLDYLYNQKVFRVKSKQYIFLTGLYNKLKSFDMQKKLTCPVINDELVNGPLYDLIQEYNEKYMTQAQQQTVLQFLCEAFMRSGRQTKYLTEHDIFKMYNKFYIEWGRLITTSRKYLFGMTKGQRRDYDKDVNSNINLMFKGEEINYKHDSSSNRPFFYTERNVHFSKELFAVMGQAMNEFMLDFKVLERKDADVYLKRLDAYNDKIDRDNKVRKANSSLADKKVFKNKLKICRNKVGMLLLALDCYSIEDARTVLNISQRTMDRYKADLKKIGYTKHSVMGKDVLTEPHEAKEKLIHADLSYSHYFMETLTNKHLFVNNTHDKLFA